MSRRTIATLLGLVFLAAYLIVVLAIPDLVGRVHWAVELLYWCLAGLLWVLPVRWLMLWAAYRR